MLIFNINKFVLMAWELLLALMLMFPRILQIPKIIICVFIILLGVICGKSRTIGYYSWTYTLNGIIYAILIILVGLYYGNPEAALVGTFRAGILNSLLLMLIISNIYHISGILEKSLSVMVFANIYIGLYNLALLGASFMGYDISMLRYFDATGNIGFHEGYSHIVSTNMSMTLLTFPMGLFLFRYKPLNKLIKPKYVLLSDLVVGLAMLFSGRRILWICLAISVLFYALIEFKNVKKFIKRILGVLLLTISVLLVSLQTGVLSLDSMFNRFIRAFGTSVGAVETVREVQAKLLINGFLENPIFGNGSGAIIPGFVRSVESPWVFELSYHVVLFQSGILGAIIFVRGLLIVFKGILKLRFSDRSLFHACITAFLIIVIANSTNPYFSSSFDFMLLIYFFVLVLETQVYKTHINTGDKSNGNKVSLTPE